MLELCYHTFLKSYFNDIYRCLFTINRSLPQIKKPHDKMFTKMCHHDITTTQCTKADDSKHQKAHHCFHRSISEAQRLTMSASMGFPSHSLQGSESLPACIARAQRGPAWTECSFIFPHSPSLSCSSKRPQIHQHVPAVAKLQWPLFSSNTVKLLKAQLPSEIYYVYINKCVCMYV